MDQTDSSHNKNPFISIIVAVYNGSGSIGRCIESLLNQDYPKDRLEIIIVDNNSTDDTARVIKSYPVQYVLENRVQAPSGARNAGVKRARGEIFVFYDADQTVDPQGLKGLINGWEDESVGAFNGKNLFDPCEDPIAFKIQHEEANRRLTGTERKKKVYDKVGGGNVAYRRDVFLKLNGFDEKMFSSEDFDLAFRMHKDLGLKVKYTEGVAYNKPRTGKALIRREYRIGFGDAMLCHKHKELRKDYLKQTYKLLKRTVLGILVLVMNSFLLAAGQKKKEKIMTIKLDLAMRWTHFMGAMRYLLIRNIPVRWQGDVE